MAPISLLLIIVLLVLVFRAADGRHGPYGNAAIRQSRIPFALANPLRNFEFFANEVERPLVEPAARVKEVRVRDARPKVVQPAPELPRRISANGSASASSSGARPRNA
jgi:hypothetical protein